jgi:DNA transformation protein
MSRLDEMQNIGKTLADKLIHAGISNAEELAVIGSESAFLRLRTIDRTACINMLFAIEGAIQGIRWHGLDKTRKKELKEFYNMIILNEK